jgi:hypothetical protein
MSVNTEHDAALVRHYVRYLQQRASAGDSVNDEAMVDHEAEVLWALARAICGEGLVTHAPLLRRVSLDLLERGGRSLCRDGGSVSAPALSSNPDEAEALKELGRALLEMRARFALQQ